MKKLINFLVASVFSFCATAAMAVGNDDARVPEEAESTVQTEVSSETDASRGQIIQEAEDALNQTRAALTALDERRTDDALEALAIAVGKLELLIARNPELALAPTSMVVETRDVYGSVGAIEKAIDEAEEHLDSGNVQAARHLLRNLGSEVVISLTNVPLGTYPEAVKAVTPMIDRGEIDEARTALQAALNTLVVTEQVLPLPILRAQTMLSIVEALADQENRTAEQNETLNAAMAAVREQVGMAQLFGYGRDMFVYKEVNKKLRELEKQLEKDEATAMLFAEAHQSLEQLL